MPSANPTPHPLDAAARDETKMRHVVVSEDYLDGIMGLDVKAPTQYDREMVALPNALVSRYEAAWREVNAAEEAIRKAWASAPCLDNPKYVPIEEIEEDDDVR